VLSDPVTHPSVADDISAVAIPLIEIRPSPDGEGYLLGHGPQEVWHALEIHAINYAQAICPECDIVVYHADGRVKHRYTSNSRSPGDQR
jgi:hypothetical protein